METDSSLKDTSKRVIFKPVFGQSSSFMPHENSRKPLVKKNELIKSNTTKIERLLIETQATLQPF